MAISFNTGTTTFITNSATPGGHTFTIPAGVASGDTVLVLVWVFTTATGALTLTLGSSATAPVAQGSQQNTGTNAGIQVSGQVFSIAAGASDPGATLTFGATGGSGGSYWYNVGLVSYTGAGGVDVIAGNQSFSATGPNTVVTPAATTVASGDWQVQAFGIGPSGSPTYAAPAGLTMREQIGAGSNAGLCLDMADSAASVGGAGTSIGGTTWTPSPAGTAGNTWITAFTVGVKVAGGTAHSDTAALTLSDTRSNTQVHGHNPVASLALAPGRANVVAYGKNPKLVLAPVLSAVPSGGSQRKGGPDRHRWWKP